MERVVITGMSIITPLGDTVELNLKKMIAGESAISRWTSVPVGDGLCQVGGDLKGRSPHSAVRDLSSQLPSQITERALKLMRRLPWATATSVEVALRASLDSGGFWDKNGEPLQSNETSVIVAGHNTNSFYVYRMVQEFLEQPDYIDPLYSVHSLDTDHAACVSEVLQLRGGCGTVGAACASGNLAIRQALDDIRYHGQKRILVVGPILDHSPSDLHGLGLMGAVSMKSFNERPQAASRPWDTHREGFVPSHGCAALVLESHSEAISRGARLHAEVLGAEQSSDGNHLPHPSVSGQVQAIKRLLASTNTPIEEIDFVSAHATSTPQGDLVEIESLKQVFGQHAYRLAINAPKSLLGHPCWSAAIVETVMAIAQMNAGVLHPSINIENLDPQIDLPIVRTMSYKKDIQYILKNSFGFGGINCVSLLKRYAR